MSSDVLGCKPGWSGLSWDGQALCFNSSLPGFWRPGVSLSQYIKMSCRFVLTVSDGISLCCMDPGCCWLSPCWVVLSGSQMELSLCTEAAGVGERRDPWAWDFHVVCLCFESQVFTSPWNTNKNRSKNFLAISFHTRNKCCKALTTTALCAQQDKKRYEHFALTVFEDVNGLNYLNHHDIAGRGNTAGQTMSSTDQKSNSCTAISWLGRTHSDVFVTWSINMSFCFFWILFLTVLIMKIKERILF